MKSRFSFLSALKPSNTRNFLLFTFFLTFSFLSGSNAFSQACHSDHDHETCTGLEAAPYNGHFYTPPAAWIMEKMSTPSQSLIGDPPCSSISVTYTGFTPEAQAAFQYAVDIWETVLSGSVTITIDANWEVLSPGILGSTGTLSERNFPGAPTTDYYAASAANQIAGFDISPGSFDMTMTFSSVFDWYLGTDGNPAFDEYDLVTVTLHEIGHGLGFSSSKKYSNTTGIGSFSVGNTGVPKNYDQFLTLGSFGTDLLDLSGTTLGDALTGNNVYNSSPLAVAANGGVAPRMYAPATYAGGSSISHWNESTYPAGNPQSLMTPQVGAGEAIHNPGEMMIGLLEDLGWTICYGDAEPCLGDFEYVDATMPGTNELITITTCNLTSDYGEILGVTIGDQYTFTSTDNDDLDLVYITIRSGTFDGPVIGEGYSPLTVTSDINGSIFAHYTADEFCDFTSIGCFTSTVQCITCPVYCELLDAVEGDPCDDGDPNTIDDVVTADCVCQGIQPCLNTTPYITRVFDGSNQVFSSGCTFEQEYNDFQNAELGSTYTFTSEDDGEAGFITIRSGTFDGPVLDFGYSPLTVVSDINGSLFVHYNVDGACATATGCVSITGQCISCPEYCPELDLAVGSPCDDGNPNTINDMVTNDCQCFGEQPCETGSLFATRTFDGTNIIITGSSCNYESEYNAYENAEIGEQYTFTSEDEGFPGFITVRSGTPDGTVIGFGFSPLTVTSDIDGTLYTHFTLNGNCDTESGNCVFTTGQCISCPVYCADLDMVEGDPCDDGNPATNYDQITEDCECAGAEPCLGDTQWLGVTMTGTNQLLTIATCNLTSDYSVIENVVSGDEYTFVSTDNDGVEPVFITVRSGTFDGAVIGAGFSPLTVISDVDGSLFPHYTADELCDFTSIGCFTSTVQCITCPVYCEELDLGVGDACDDGDPNTFNDTVNADCICQGAPENDLCSDAIELDCDAYVVGTNVGASLNTGCDGDERQTVWYSFTADELSSVFMTTCNPETNYDTDINMYTGSCDGGLVCFTGWGGSGYIDGNAGCSFQTWASEGTFTAEQGVTYYIAVTGFYAVGSSSGWEGNFGLSLTCETIYDCPLLSANIGDACDDGNVNTINDVITADCNCEGEVPAATASLLTLPCGGQVIQITGALSGPNGGGTATSDTRTIYSFAPDGVGGIIPSYSGSAWPYVLIGSSINVPAEISASITFNELGYLSVNGRLAYQFVGDGSPADASGPGGPWSYFLPNGDESQDACPVDCPILGANIGDACDDGNPNTLNDVVTVDCICAGVLPVPANDLCENAESLDVNLPGDCAGNETEGTTLGATSSSDLGCEGPNPEVFYSFNSGEYTNIQFNIAEITTTDILLTIYEGGCDGLEVYCSTNFNVLLTLTPFTDYIVEISTNPGFGDFGSFSICLEGAYDCPLLAANIGDACDDGNPNTDDDTVNSDCNCEGVSNEVAVLTGSADWNNSCGDRGLTVNFYEPGTNVLVISFSTSIDANGDFNLGEVPVGTFDIFAKIDGRLANGYYNETITVGANSLALGSFIPGDLNNNNGINITDFSLLNISFGSSEGDANYNFLADMNCDGNVNIIDVSILNIGFGQVGDSPGAP